MRTAIATGFLFASVSLASADATLTFALTGAGAANTSKTMVVSDADGQRILTWAKDASISGPVIVAPIETNPLVCNVAAVPPQCLQTTRPLTSKEAIEAVFNGLFIMLRTNVQNLESGKASKTATDSVTAIAPK